MEKKYQLKLEIMIKNMELADQINSSLKRELAQLAEENMSQKMEVLTWTQKKVQNNKN